MGSFGESSQKENVTTNQTQKVNQTTKTDPWGPQAGYLKDVFGKAGDLADNYQKFEGEQVAGMRPEQVDLFGKMIGYANTSPIAAMLASQGGNLASAGQYGYGTGLMGLGGFNPQDMQGIIDAGNKFAQDPNIQGMTDGIMRDDWRQTFEQNIPGIERNAALKGNTNSSRTGAREAILERGYDDRYADVKAGLTSNAYNRGIESAQQGRDQELARLMGLTGTGLQGSMAGMQGLQNSVSTMGQLFGLGNEGGAGLREGDQALLDNELKKYAFGQDTDWGNLMNYYNIVGGNNWGGTQNTKGTTQTNGTSSGKTVTQASPAAVTGGILTSIGSLIPG